VYELYPARPRRFGVVGDIADAQPLVLL
jgi:hypothetical protein